MALLIKATNTSATANSVAGLSVPVNGSLYVQLGQGRVVTNAAGTITAFNPNNSGTPVTDLSDWLIEVGNLTSGGYFQTMISSR